MADKSKTSLDCLIKKQLVAACKTYRVKTTGNKDVLRVALKEHLNENNITFQVYIYKNIETRQRS